MVPLVDYQSCWLVMIEVLTVFGCWIATRLDDLDILSHLFGVEDHPEASPLRVEVWAAVQQAIIVVDDVDDPEVLIEDGRVLLHNKEDRVLCVSIESQLEAADHGVSVDVITPTECFVKELLHLLW